MSEAPFSPGSGLCEDLREVVFDASTIAGRVQALGAQIHDDYRERWLRVGAEDQAERELVCVGVLKGSFVFMADLLRAIDLPLVVDFMALSSYAGTRSTGAVRILKDLERSIDGRDVLIIEDIIDTGLTMTYLLKSLEARKPASIRVCSLLDKKEARLPGAKELAIHYAGFPCPDAFVVGYGLDYRGRYRNLPFIGALDPKIYSTQS